MRIGIDIRVLSEDKTTGVEIFTFQLVKNLLFQDTCNEYLLFYNNNNLSESAKTLSRFPNAKIFRYRYPNKVMNLLFLVFNFPRIEKLLGDIDIFFSPRQLFSSTVGRAKSVVTMHDLSFIVEPSFFSFKQRLWHMLISDKKACQRSDAILAVSNSTKRDIVKYFQIPESKIHVIYPGIDHDKFNPNVPAASKSAVRKKYNLDSDYILYLGTVEPRKNIAGIIKAFETYRNDNQMVLVLAGKLGWLYKEVIKQVRSSGYRPDIRMISDLSEDAKPALIAAAKMVVFPSFYEGFGFPPLEAMACGVPCIVAINSSFPETLSNTALFVNPFDCVSIASAMKVLTDDESVRGKIINSGLENAKKYDWAKTASMTLKLFKEFAAI